MKYVPRRRRKRGKFETGELIEPAKGVFFRSRYQIIDRYDTPLKQRRVELRVVGGKTTLDSIFLPEYDLIAFQAATWRSSRFTQQALVALCSIGWSIVISLLAF